MNNDSITQWAIIELMGHSRIAGRYSEQNGLHRIDVPETDIEAKSDDFRFTRFYAPAAIYSITLMDEPAARMAAKVLDQPAITVWELQREINRQARQLTAPATIEAEQDEEDPDYDF